MKDKKRKNIARRSGTPLDSILEKALLPKSCRGERRSPTAQKGSQPNKVFSLSGLILQFKYRIAIRSIGLDAPDG